VPLKPDMPKRPTNMEYKCCAMSRRHISLKRKQTRIVAFQFLDEDEHVHARSKWIPFHMIFDVKTLAMHIYKLLLVNKFTQLQAQNLDPQAKDKVSLW